MVVRVPYRSEDEIERDAELLLAEYEETVGAPIKLPVLVADITTYHSRYGSISPICTKPWTFPCCATNLTSSVQSGSIKKPF
jgi:hypothetical protein